MSLTARECEHNPAGKYYDRDGLILIKRDKNNGKWVMRYRMFGRRPNIGLGTYPEVKLGQARELVAEYRQMIKMGIDPKLERTRVKDQHKHLFEQIAMDAFEAKKAELRGDGKAGRWWSPIEHHVIPRIGKVPVTKIDQNVIKDCLAPIWHDKAPTAKKAIDRIGIVIRHGAAMGLNVDTEAVTKAKALLGKQRHKTKGIVMMPWKEVPGFYQSLCAEKLEDQTVTKLLLRMLILTGIRTKAVRLMNLSEIDGDIWTAPGDNLKGSKDAVPDYRVPLTDEMKAVIEQAKPFTQNGFVFAGPRGKPISDVVGSRYMADRGYEARPHGFRKSLRTWVSECTDTPWEIGEFLIEHDRRDGTAKRYDLTDYLEKRRPIMDRWSRYVTGAESATILKLADG